MWDGSAVPLQENLQIAADLLAKCAAAHAVMEMEIGVVGGEEEGMLLYVRQTQFLEPPEAVAGWNASKLDALVVPDDEIDGLIAQLQGDPKKWLTSGRAGRYAKRYFLLVR